MRWMLLLVCAGCPASDPLADAPLADAPLAEADAPPDAAEVSNCLRGPAPPVTWCRERYAGYDTGSASQSSAGSTYVYDWVNGTNGVAGRDESIYGERGIVIEQTSTGSYAGHMYAICDDEGRTELGRFSYAWQRTRYDTADHMLSFEWDQQADGVYEDRWSYRYEHDLVVRDEHDAGIGTAIDLVDVYAYDTRGRMLTSTRDRGADGTIDETTHHVWDDQDREIDQTTVDHDGELLAHWTWTYDGPRLIEIELAGDTRWTYHYDAAGRLTTTDFFNLKTNTLDARTTQRYDPAGRPIAYDEDDGVDGTIDEHVAWDYCP